MEDCPQPTGSAAAALSGLCVPGLQPARHRTSAQVTVELDLWYRGEPIEARHTAARAALQLASLSGGYHTPAELSGGQQAGVAVARQLSPTRPSCWQMSQPAIWTPKPVMKSSRLRTSLNEDKGITVLMVTHEPEMAEYAKRIIRFVDGNIDSDIRHRPINSTRRAA